MPAVKKGKAKLQAEHKWANDKPRMSSPKYMYMTRRIGDVWDVKTAAVPLAGVGRMKDRQLA